MASLMVRLPNHLGDVCMALPALDCLAKSGVTLTVAGRAWAAGLLAAYPWRFVGLPAGRAEAVVALRAAQASGPRPQDAVLFTNSFSSALQFRLAGLRPSGFATDGRRLLLRTAIAVPREWAADMHTVAYYLHLARAVSHQRMGPPLSRRPWVLPAPQLRLTPLARLHAAAAVAAAGVSGSYIVLCPTARGRHQGKDKCWDGFGRLADELAARGHPVVVCPAADEEAAARAAVPGARFIEPLELGTFAALLAASRLVVANDSGPGHLAAAVGAPLVGVFGVTDPTKTRPIGAWVRIVGRSSGWPPYEEVAATVRTALGGA